MSRPCASIGYSLLQRSEENDTLIVNGKNGTKRAWYKEKLLNPLTITKNLTIVGVNGHPVLSFTGVSLLFLISRKEKKIGPIVKFEKIELEAVQGTETFVSVLDASFQCRDCHFRGAADGIKFTWSPSWPNNYWLSVINSQFVGVRKGIVALNNYGFVDLSIRNCTFQGKRGKSKTAFQLNNLLHFWPYPLTNIKITVQQSKFTNFFGGIDFSIDKIDLFDLVIDGCEFRQQSAGAIVINTGKSKVKPNLKISNTIFYNNTRDSGAALYVMSQRHTNVTVTNCMFDNNLAYAMGGAVATIGQVTLNIQRCNFSHNQCSYNDGVTMDYGRGAGGALAIDSYESYAFGVSISWCHFEGNSATSYGGTIYAKASSAHSRIEIVQSNISAPITEQLRASVGDVIYSSSFSRLSGVRMTVNNPMDGKSILQYGDRILEIDTRSKVICSEGFQVKMAATSISGTDISNFGAKNPKKYRTFSMWCKLCSYNHYSTAASIFTNFTPKNAACEKCPPGGQCNFGILRANPNFWGFKNKMNGKVEFVRLLDGYGCNGKECKAYNSCMVNRMGPLCAKCKPGFSEDLLTTNCIENSDCKTFQFWVISSLLFLAYIGFFLYKKDIFLRIKQEALWIWQRKNPAVNLNTVDYALYDENGVQIDPNEQGNNDSSMAQGLLKIIFYFYQTETILNSERTNIKNNILQETRSFASSFFNFKFGNTGNSALCFKANANPIEKLFARLALVTAIFIALILLYAFIAIKRLASRTNSNKALANRVLSALFEASILCYAVFLHGLFQLMNCANINGEHVLYIQGDVECSKWWHNLLVLTTVMWLLPFCLFVFCLPYLLLRKRAKAWSIFAGCIFPLPWLLCHILGFVYIKFIKRQNYDQNDAEAVEDDGAFVTSVKQMLTSAFRKNNGTSECIWWEGMLLLRRFILTAALTFLHDIYVKVYTALVLQLIFLLQHVHVQPYNIRILNIIETSSLTLLTIIGSMNFLNSLDYGGSFENVDSSRILQQTFAWTQVVIASCVPLMLCIISVIVFVLIALRMLYRLYSCIRVLPCTLGRQNNVER